MVGRPVSVARPPWFDTMMPSAPLLTASVASSALSSPLMTTFIFVTSFTRFTKSHVSVADVSVTSFMSMPVNIGLTPTVRPSAAGPAPP